MEQVNTAVVLSGAVLSASSQSWPLCLDYGALKNCKHVTAESMMYQQQETQRVPAKAPSWLKAISLANPYGNGWLHDLRMDGLAQIPQHVNISSPFPPLPLCPFVKNNLFHQ